MSRHLPDRPNLEHLRNQAKSLLASLERTHPDAKLADALHAIALEYGFASWPKLKSHVDAVRLASGGDIPDSPFVGRWIANVSRSVRHPANQFREAVMHFTVEDDTVTITHGFVEESGRRQHAATTLEVDGEEHATDNGYGVTASWTGSNALETVATKDGEVVGRGRYEVSADGATLTISAPDQVIVLDRAPGLTV